MTTRILIAAGLAAVLAGGSAAALEQPPQSGRRMERKPGKPVAPRQGPRRTGPGIDLGLRGIDLTDAQREQVRVIGESHKAEFGEVATKLRAAQHAFVETVQAESIDEAAIRTGSAAVASAMADEAILRARVRLEVHGILTPEQQQQLRDRRAQTQKRLLERQKQRPRPQGR